MVVLPEQHGGQWQITSKPNVSAPTPAAIVALFTRTTPPGMITRVVAFGLAAPGGATVPLMAPLAGLQNCHQGTVNSRVQVPGGHAGAMAPSEMSTTRAGGGAAIRTAAGGPRQVTVQRLGCA
jgi:hypothetical protein